MNSPPEVWDAEIASITQSRAVALRPDNDYRRLARFPRARRIEDISSDCRMQERLHDVYGERRRNRVLSRAVRRGRTVLPALIGRMVVIDAFSQAFTNPLLEPRVFTRGRSRRAGGR